MSDFVVFVSSTRIDLHEHRKVVSEMLERAGQKVLAMEDFGSRPGDALTVSTEEVRNCTLFVGIYGFRYGYTPVEGGESITESEYRFAQEQGKRRLCYFADEATESDFRGKPEWEEEGQAKTENLERFKRLVGEDRVIDKFTSAADLAVKLAADLTRLLKGDPVGWTNRDVCPRWRGWQRRIHKELRHNILEDRRGLVASPLLPQWNEFLSVTPWHSQMQGEVAGICRRASQFPELQRLVARAKAVNFQAPYVDLASALDDAFRDDDLATVARLRRHRQAEQERGADSLEELLLLELLDGEIRRLRRELADPCFRRCFLVLGEMGAGKTHFLAECLATSLESEGPQHWYRQADWEESDDEPTTPPSPGLKTFMLVLPPHPELPLEEVLLKQIREVTKLPWRSLDEVNRFCEDPDHNIRLIITIDDLQNWCRAREEFVDELERFIVRHTDLHALGWLITLQDTWYDHVARHSRFWTRYSLPDDSRRRGTQSPPSLAGWLVLDDLNRRRRTGLAILDKALSEGQDTDWHSLEFIDEEARSRRHLANPFVAWILFDLRREIDLSNMVNLNFIEFVQHFWKKRRAAIALGEFSSADLERTISFLSRVFAESKDFALPFVQVLDRFVEEAGTQDLKLRTPEVAKRAIEAVVDANLLKRDDFRASPYKPPVDGLQLLFEVFWEYHLANGLFDRELQNHKTPATIGSSLRKWFGEVDEAYAAGIYEFLLLIADKAAASADIDRGLATDVWRLGAHADHLPPESVWFAMPKASEEVQRAVLGIEPLQLPDDRRTTFAFTYALAEASSNVIDRATRFRRWQPLFAAIKAGQLNSYYLYVAKHHLRQVEDNAELLACLWRLSGVEQLGGTAELAKVAVATLWKNSAKDDEEEYDDYYDDDYDETYGGEDDNDEDDNDEDDNDEGDDEDELEDERVDAILEYLQSEQETAAREYRRPGRPKQWKREFFREWVIYAFCHRLAMEQGSIRAYRILDDYYWFDPDRPKGPSIGWPIKREMEQEANIALGFYYRTRASEGERQDFEQLVTDLANSSNWRRRSQAFHMIRHTEAIALKGGTRVNAVFRPVLRRLRTDPKLAAIVKRFKPFFDANLEAAQKRPQ